MRKLILTIIMMSLFALIGCGINVDKQGLDQLNTLTTPAAGASVVPVTQPLPATTSATAVAPSQAPSPAQTTPKARVDFKSEERIAASKAWLAKTYPDSFATQKMLQDAAVKDQSELEVLVNSLTDSDWASLARSYTSLVNTYKNSPSTVLILFQEEIKAFRSLK